MSAENDLGKLYADLQSQVVECAGVFGPALVEALRHQGAIIQREMTAYYATPYKADAPTGQTPLP